MQKIPKLLIASLIGTFLIASTGALTLGSFAEISCSFAPVYGACTPFLFDDVVNSDPDIVQADIQAKAVKVEDQRLRRYTEHMSHINQTEGMGMTQAKMVAIEELNNGSTTAEAKQRAFKEVDKFWSAQYESLIAHHNIEVIKFNDSVLNTVERVDGLSHKDIWKDEPLDLKGGYNDLGCGGASGLWDYSNNVRREVRDFYLFEKNFTLPNGENRTLKGVKAEVYEKNRFVDNYWGGGEHEYRSCTKNKTIMPADLNEDSTRKLVATNPNNGNTSVYFNHDKWHEINNEIKEVDQRAEENINLMINEIYDNYEPGDISVNGVLGPLEELKVASTNYDTTGHYSYLATSLEQMGLATNESFAFKIRWNNSGEPEKTRWGQLFGTEESFDTINVNETYDASDKTAWIVHRTPDGNAESTELNGNFKVLEMRNQDTGKSINQTTIQETDFRTRNTTKLEKQLNEIREQQKQLQNQVTGGGAVNDALSWLSNLLSGIGLGSIGTKATALIIGTIFILLLAIT